jgi:hypothetical protein
MNDGRCSNSVKCTTLYEIVRKTLCIYATLGIQASNIDMGSTSMTFIYWNYLFAIYNIHILKLYIYILYYIENKEQKCSERNYDSKTKVIIILSNYTMSPKFGKV